MSVPSVRAVSATKHWTVQLSDNMGHEWLGDEPIEAGGSNLGPSPAHLLLSALATCTVMTLQMYAERKQWPLSGVEVEVLFNPNGKPADGATEITRRISLRGALAEEQRERLLQVANACPMHKVLTGEVRVTTSVE
jgi:putative redox protein